MTQEERNKLSPREKFAERCTWHEGDIQIVAPKTELDFAYLAAAKPGLTCSPTNMTLNAMPPYCTGIANKSPPANFRNDRNPLRHRIQSEISNLQYPSNSPLTSATRSPRNSAASEPRSPRQTSRRAIGAAARNTIIAHLSNLQSTRPNKHGWPRQGYWASAARSVTQPIDHGDAIVIGIQQVGIALHYYGGTITPKQSKYLTLPTVPEAYDKRLAYR